MKWTVSPLDLESRYVFRIARGASRHFANYLVELEADDEVGRGEGAPVEYLQLDRETGVKALEAGMGEWLQPPESLNDLERIFDEAWLRLGEDRPAVCALDTALWDLWGKIVDLPVWSMIGAEPDRAPVTSYTIGIDEPKVMLEKMEEAERFSAFKVKVGYEGDVETVEMLRRSTDKPFRVDANEGWTLDDARRKIPLLADLGVEAIEQPLPRAHDGEMAQLKELSSIPLIADESCLDPAEVAAAADRFHGINIKLVKCGGITPALRMIRLAREAGIKVMIGCMLESSVGITAAAHLSPFVDLADLDGNVLLAEDPFRGVEIEAGRLVLPQSAGLGVERAV